MWNPNRTNPSAVPTQYNPIYVFPRARYQSNPLIGGMPPQYPTFSTGHLPPPPLPNNPTVQLLPRYVNTPQLPANEAPQVILPAPPPFAGRKRTYEEMGQLPSPLPTHPTYTHPSFSTHPTFATHSTFSNHPSLPILSPYYNMGHSPANEAPQLILPAPLPFAGRKRTYGEMELGCAAPGLSWQPQQYGASNQIPVPIPPSQVMPTARDLPDLEAKRRKYTDINPEYAAYLAIITFLEGTESKTAPPETQTDLDFETGHYYSTIAQAHDLQPQIHAQASPAHTRVDNGTQRARKQKKRK